MIETSSAVKEPPLLSPRTADYIAALIREGDNFDYCRWLEKAREEEPQAERRPQTSTLRKIAPAEVASSIGTPDRRKASANWTLLPRRVPIRKGMPYSYHKSTDSSAARIRRRLEGICDAWNDLQGSRARDAVYGYLEAVFAIVEHYKVRRRTKRFLRHAPEFANLSFDKNADPFTAVIRCTCDHSADSETISKWARALRYAARSKVAPAQLKTFMKEAGGVNACADLYARYFGRGAQ
jgi:hypothetical protein